VWNALILTSLVVLAGGAAAGGGQRPGLIRGDGPQLILDESVAADFRALAVETWERFLTVFRARQDCFGDVHLKAADRLDSRADYDPETATASVRVPATAAMLQSALIHEWAHHVEFQCKAQRDLRAAFLAAQGLPPDTPWRAEGAGAKMPTSAWAEMPSEQYAEATITLVLGGRPVPTKARITKEAVGVIENWAAGD
jgi:hypothetical protein